MRGWTVILLLAWCGADCLAQPQSSVADLLTRAVERYESAMEAQQRDERMRGFAAAEQLFRQALETNRAELNNATLYVNLGNAALQAEHIGPAIVAFRRALELDPTNVQAQQNLGFARSVVPETFRREVSGGLVDALFFWTSLFSRHQVMGIASVCFLLAAALFALGWGLKQSLLRYVAFIPAVGWALCLLSLGIAGDSSESANGVVIANEVILRSADSENSPARISEALASGVEVRVLRERERWTEVEVPGGRTGWVQRTAVEVL